MSDSKRERPEEVALHETVIADDGSVWVIVRARVEDNLVVFSVEERT